MNGIRKKIVNKALKDCELRGNSEFYDVDALLRVIKEYTVLIYPVIPHKGQIKLALDNLKQKYNSGYIVFKTKRDLAAQMGISEKTLYNWENSNILDLHGKHWGHIDSVYSVIRQLNKAYNNKITDK